MTCSNTKNNIIERIVCLFFVVSLGLGEIASYGGVKLSYIATLIFFIYTVFIKKKRGLIKRKMNLHFAFFLAFWVFYACLQVMWVKDFSLWFSFFRTLLINILVILLMLNFAESYQDWVMLARSFLFLIFICLLVGVWEYSTGQHLHYMNYDEMNENTVLAIKNKPLSFFGNINDNSSVLFLGLIVSLILFGSEKATKLHTKIFRICFLCLIVAEILLINARAITYSLPFLLLLLLFFFFLGKLLKGNQGKMKNALLLCVVALLFAVAIALAARPMDYYLGLISSGTDYASDLGRVSVLKNGFLAFLETGGLGLGAGQSILVNEINLHSLYLEILFEYGILVGGYMLIVFAKIVFVESKGVKGIADCTIRSFPIVLILAGVSSSKLFSLRPFWIAFCLIYILKYQLFREECSEVNIVNRSKGLIYNLDEC